MIINSCKLQKKKKKEKKKDAKNMLDVHILQSGRKNNNMSGRSGIGVLVAGFSRVGASKKHAPLIFTIIFIIGQVDT